MKNMASHGRVPSLRLLGRRGQMRRLLAGVGLCGLTISVTLESALGQEMSSQTNKIVWDDGSVDFHAPDFPFAHVHGDQAVKADERTLASMTPGQRAAYEQKQKEADVASHERLARAYRFGQVAKEDTSPLAEAYRAAQKAFQTATIKLVSVMNRYALVFEATPAEIQELDKAWVDSLSAAHAARKEWVSKGAELFLSDPEKYKNVGLALKEMIIYDVTADRTDAWAGVGKRLLELDESKLDRDWIFNAITTCLANNEYDDAIRFGEILKGDRFKDQIDDRTKAYIETFPDLKKEWERELVMREQDAAKDSNPRVELITSKGKVVLELFEDAAPNTVANFIYLVERSYYDKKAFFRVENLTVAQTGCEKNDGSGSAGYTIGPEATEENYRGHFRGSVALALGTSEQGVDRNSGSSQFYLCFMPLSHLNKDYTVFARVIEGMENLSLLRHLNLANKKESESAPNPDMVLSAKVIRKRDHEYRPTPNKGRLFH